MYSYAMVQSLDLVLLKFKVNTSLERGVLNISNIVGENDRKGEKIICSDEQLTEIKVKIVYHLKVQYCTIEWYKNN